MSTPAFYVANFKSALSGDTLVVAPPKNPGQQERIVNLAWVSAPHMKKEGDEEFAFQSRDYLRRLCVNQQLKIHNEYTIPSMARQYVTAELRDGTKLPEAMVHAGWLKVREEAGRREEDEEILERLDKLRFYESEAKEETKGLWCGKSGLIEVKHEITDGNSFLEEWKGKTVEGRVERVISGDRLLVRLLLSDKKHMQLITLLAGVRAPATERNVGGRTQPAEEYGNEARQFVEVRLLQREVIVVIVGLSPQNQLIASVLHPARGNVAEFLLSEGLARCNDFHSTLLADKMPTLRSCEKKAQAEKKRLHKNHVSKAGPGGNLDMIVSKILSADTVIVRTKAGDERRISFSSCRGPRTTDPGESPFKDEAKEYLRKRLIGKHVVVSIDGHKPASDGFDARDVATVTEKGKNIGLQLIQDGWCSVIRHKKDDTDRAPNYDELLAVQETAQGEKKGMWSGKPKKPQQYTDYSSSVKDASRILQTLKRQRKMPAVIDFCKSGSRFTILIRKENAKITMVLAGVRAPKAPRNTGEVGDPFGQESLDFANRRCNQRDCEVDILDIDKVGGFVGNLYVARENFAKVLVEEGLASVHAYSAKKTGNPDLVTAEKNAKQARKGMWKDWESSQDECATEEEPEPSAEADTASSITQRPKNYRNIFITHVEGDGRLKVQEIGKGTAALETMMNDFRKAQDDPRNKTPYKEAPKAGEYVAAKFSLDNFWYRARVRSNDRPAKQSEVVYIDYGNTEKLPWSSIRPLDQGKYGVRILKAQVSDAVLSLAQMPTHPDYLAEAVGFILDCTTERRLVANIDFVDTRENISHVTVFNSEAGTPGEMESLNRDVVANGHAMVPRKLKPWERSKGFEAVLKSLKEAENKAKADRMGMWEYGDLTED